MLFPSTSRRRLYGSVNPKKVIVAFSLASSLLVSVSIAAYNSATRLQKAAEIQIHTKAV